MKIDKTYAVSKYVLFVETVELTSDHLYGLIRVNYKANPFIFFLTSHCYVCLHIINILKQGYFGRKDLKERKCNEIDVNTLQCAQHRKKIKWTQNTTYGFKVYRERKSNFNAENFPFPKEKSRNKAQKIFHYIKNNYNIFFTFLHKRYTYNVFMWDFLLPKPVTCITVALNVSNLR